MSLLHKIIRLLYSTLARQVAAIHSEGGRSLFRLIFGTVFPLFFIRRLTFLVSAIFRLPYYFQLDLAYKATYDETEYLQFNINDFLINTFSAIFDWRVYLLFYFTPSRRVWSHLYDLVVRNREQASFKLWHFVPPEQQQTTENRENENETRENAQNWLTQFKHLFRPTFELTSSLVHYPQLEAKLRIKLLLIAAILELIITPTVLYPFYHFALNQIVDNSDHRYTTLQLVYYYLVKAMTRFYVATYSMLYYLVKLITCVLCTLYAAQYRALNFRLKQVKDDLQKMDSATLSRLTEAYRAEHIRLTAFILHLNESTVSKIIVYYIHYVVPYHAFETVRLYLQRRRFTPSEWLYQSYYMFNLTLLLLVITFFTARANDQVAASGPVVASILARKGLMVARKRKSSWASSSQEASWANREVVSLSLHYEVIWRAEKELAFTAGVNSVTMNWSYVWEVNILIDSKYRSPSVACRY